MRLINTNTTRISKKLIIATDPKNINKNTTYQPNLSTTGCSKNEQLTSQQTKCLPIRPVPAGALDHPPLTETKTRITIKIATLNTRTLKTEESLMELEKSLEKINFDILGLCEMRRLDEKIEEREGYILFQKGIIAGQRGVGFMIKKSLKENIVELIGISDRLAVLNIKLPGYKKIWTITQVYAPTEKATKQDIEDFYNDLSDITMKYNNNNIIIMGDFNAQVGTRETGEEHVLGKYSYGERSANGYRLLDFLIHNNLTLLNSIYKKKPRNKWTWLSPNGNNKNEIDFIITNKVKHFNDTHVIQNLNFNTDHRMVRSCLNVIPTKNSRKAITNTKTFLPEEYKQIDNPFDIKSLLQIVNSDISVRKKYDHLDRKLSQIKKINKNNDKTKFSNRTLTLLEERKSLISIKNKDRKKFATLSNKIRESMRKDRKLKRTKILEEKIIKTGGTKKAFKELREYGKEWIPKLKSNKSGLETKRKNIQKLATDYYRNLYSDTDKDQELEKQIKPRHTNNDIPPVLKSEVERAILSQKMEKAPGPDHIPNELLRGTIEELSPILTKLFNDVLYTGIIPDQWGETHIILLHKKGHKEDINNYRPISLISNIYKVFAKVILGRIAQHLDETQPIEQAGFRKNYSTIDHIHTIKQILEKYNEYHKPIYITFIDYSKAFDSLNHNYIWSTLEKQGVDDSYINIVKNIYNISKGSIKLETTGNSFPINRGVRQGDPLSPNLFTAVLENIFKSLDWDGYGLNINGCRLNHLRFADDLILLEEDTSKIQEMVKSLAEESKKVGLQINTVKTKLMTNSIEIDIVLDGNKLEYVQEYVYLGQLISPIDQMSKELNKRISSGWRKYWSLKEIMKSKELNMTIKRRTFETCILPCITYGCETWSLTQNHREKLAKCQRAMERSMLHIKLKDKITTTEIRNKTKVTDILTRIDQLKWRWTGHMLRCKTDKWSKQVTLWYPRDGNRLRGRPTRRWEDDFRLALGPYWTRVAIDRVQWKQLEEAYVKRHTELRDIL